MGPSCQFCKPGFYHAAGNIKNACLPCGCYQPGSKSETCSAIGQCECRQGYRGRTCQYIDEDVLLWNENVENDRVDEDSHVQDRCRSAVYSCPAGDVFDNTCGQITINPQSKKERKRFKYLYFLIISCKVVANHKYYLSPRNVPESKFSQLIHITYVSLYYRAWRENPLGTQSLK